MSSSGQDEPGTDQQNCLTDLQSCELKLGTDFFV